MCNNPRYFKNIYNPKNGKLYPVPCRHCSGCRIDRRKLWEMRITSEFVKYRCAFVTFTYDDYHLPYNAGSFFPTVRNDDFCRFIDRLRHYTNKINMPEFCTNQWKFVACSEYGSKTKRPHFHAIFLGLDWLYFKSLFERFWHNGLVDVGPVFAGGIRYVLKYMDKQQYGEYAHKQYTDYGLEIPRMFFSKGIGKDFLISQKDNINNLGFAKIGNRFVPVPSYWKNKLTVWNEDIIDKRQKISDSYVSFMNRQAVSLGYPSYEDLIQEQRKAIELANERKSLNQHLPIERFSDDILPLHNPFSDLQLNYTSSVLTKILERY